MGKVVGVEHVSGLVEMGERNVRKEKGEEGGAALLRDGTIRFVKGDGRLGWKEDAPYDAIHVGAAAKSVHAELVEQLKRPGRWVFIFPTCSAAGFWLLTSVFFLLV